MKCCLCPIIIFLFLPFALFSKDSIETYSPDGSLRCLVQLNSGQVSFTLQKSGRPILEKGMLEVNVNDENYGEKLVAISKQSEQIIRKQIKTRGTHSQGWNWYRELEINLANIGQKDYRLWIRLYNTGFAYRYQFNSVDSCSIDEKTRFRFPENTKIWMQEDIKYYEGMYHSMLIDSIKADKVAGPPIIAAYGKGLYAALTEVDLDDFAGMALQTVDNRYFQIKMSGNTRRIGAIKSPWRLIMVGSLNELVNNDFMANLSPSPDKKLFGKSSEWIRPGLSVWSWLTDYNVASKYVVGFEDMKQFSKWAGQLGIPYNLVDDGWSNWKQGDKDHWALMKELVDYSRLQGVRVWLWKAYPDFKGIEGINTPEKMKDFFRKCAEAGVVGVKIDFFNHEGQEINRFYRAALEEAARYKIMVNFHGSNKPTGLQHQYPNEMSREGIQGNEYGPNSRRAVVLPFTRLLVGPGDYTPLILSKDNPSDTSWRQRYHREMTGGASWCFQIATTVLFSSPILCLSASPTDIIESGLQDFITRIPVEWDETIVMPPSEIGELVIMARRKGRDWYLVAVTEKPVQHLEVPLGFLGSGVYQAIVLRDNPEVATSFIEERQELRSTDRLSLSMRSSGGFVVRFSKN